MVEGWKIYQLNKGIETIIDYRGKTPKKSSEGIPLISAANIKNGKLNFTKASYISKKDYAKWTIRGFTKPNDILITTEAPVGEVALYPNDGKTYQISRRVIALRADEKNIHSKFLLYILQHRPTIEALLANNRGSTVPRVLKTDITELELKLPTLPEQKAIASILSALDDKIELNLQMNKTLEDMAMALYRHWFVDFGPFQDGAFVDSELGRIPEGWEVKGILDIADLLSGGTPKTKIKEYWNGDINWVSAKDIGNGVIYINDTEKKITEKGVNNSSTKILPEDTVILVARGSVGKYGMIAKPMAMNQSCYGLFTKGDFSQGLVFLTFSMLITQFQRMSYGSVFDTITTSTFKATKVIYPPKKVIGELKEIIDPIFLQLKQNTLENQTLTQLRDTLLPNLISGKVRLKDIAHILAQTP